MDHIKLCILASDAAPRELLELIIGDILNVFHTDNHPDLQSSLFINRWPGPSILMLWLVSSWHLFVINLTSIMRFVNFFLPFSFLHLTYTLSPISYNLCECFFTGLITCSSSLSEAFLVFSLHVCVFFKCRLWSDIVGSWTSVVVMSPLYADLAFTNLFDFLPKYT